MFVRYCLVYLTWINFYIVAIEFQQKTSTFALRKRESVNRERYHFSTNDDYLNFEFESSGPNRKIKKFVRYSPQNEGGTTFFNLAFGHWNEETRELDDKAISNNKDSNKILGRVAATVVEFTKHFPDMSVLLREAVRREPGYIK